jgi:hypothetical protein
VIVSEALHILKRPSRGWIVKPAGSRQAASVHRTQADAIAAGRRLAQESGGAELIVHRADGRVRAQDPGTRKAPSRNVRATSRAPRSKGPRTTLRVPAPLAETAEEMARELEISHNDALLRLATRGARLYERERSVAARRAARWAAVVPGAVDVEGADFPPPEDARRAIIAAREDDRPRRR